MLGGRAAPVASTLLLRSIISMFLAESYLVLMPASSEEGLCFREGKGDKHCVPGFRSGTFRLRQVMKIVKNEDGIFVFTGVRHGAWSGQ